MITHLESDILECEINWALAGITMNKASGGDGLPAELFQILKDDALKCCTQYVSRFGKLSSGHGTPIPKKGNAKECSHYCTIVLILQASKVMLKILQVGLQQRVN